MPNTGRIQEYRKKCQNIADLTQDSNPGTEVATEKGKIYIGEDEYIQQVSPPDPTSVLQLSLPRLNEIMETQVEKGPTMEAEGNVFTGYSICTNNPQMVNDAYMKIRLNHAGARHIICAYQFPGLKKAQCSDSCDDDDYGASLPVLQMLMENNITHRAVFVVRKCGDKLHQKRIPMYLKTATETINRNSYNGFVRKEQFVKEKIPAEPVSSYAAAAASPPKDEPQKKKRHAYVNRGRGGGRGRGGRGRGHGRGHSHGNSDYKQRYSEHTKKQSKPIVYTPRDSENETTYKFATPWEEHRAQQQIDVD